MRAGMYLLAAELVLLVALFAVDDVVHQRGPTATWSTSFRVIGAAALAVALVTWLQGSVHGDVL